MLIKKENAAIMALVTGGELIVFKDNAQQYTQLARYKVSESPTWAHPVIPGFTRCRSKYRSMPFELRRFSGVGCGRGRVVGGDGDSGQNLIDGDALSGGGGEAGRVGDDHQELVGAGGVEGGGRMLGRVIAVVGEGDEGRVGAVDGPGVS